MPLPQNPWPRTAACWLYDEIMRNLNPDLMIERIPLLDKKYAGESHEEHAARMQQYQQTFDVYDQVYAQAADLYAQESHRIKENVRAHAMREEAAEQGSEIASVEQKLGSFSDQ